MYHYLVKGDLSSYCHSALYFLVGHYFLYFFLVCDLQDDDDDIPLLAFNIK